MLLSESGVLKPEADFQSSIIISETRPQPRHLPCSDQIARSEEHINTVKMQWESWTRRIHIATINSIPGDSLFERRQPGREAPAARTILDAIAEELGRTEGKILWAQMPLNRYGR